jgi:hypothetical protein
MKGGKIHEYDLDTTQVTDYGVGTVNFASGRIHIDGYMR